MRIHHGPPLPQDGARETPMISSLDVVFGVIALFFVVRGLFRGLLKEVLSTLGVVAAWWLGGQYGSSVAQYLKSWFESQGLAEFVGYLVVFFSVMTLVKIVAWGIAKILKASPVAWVDMPGGALVGLAKAWLMSCVVLAGLLAFLPEADFVQRSMLVPYLRPGAEYLQEKMPKGMNDFDPAGMLPGAGSLMGGDKDVEKDQDDAGMTDKARELMGKITESIKSLNEDKTNQ